MSKRLLLAAIFVTGLTGSLFGGDDDTAVIDATKTYVAANSGMTKITVAVEQIADEFARVRVVPEDSKAADPAWVFLKKKDGKWIGLTFGTSLTTEDYQQLGIPNALRIP